MDILANEDPWGGRRCQGLKPNQVDRCKGYAMGGSPYCNFHDLKINHPDKLQEMRVNGGKASRKWFHKDEIEKKANAGSDMYLKALTDQPLETPEDVKKLLADVLRGVMLGYVTAERAATVSQMANSMLTAMRTSASTPGGETANPVPEIKEIVHSGDERSKSEDYPGSEFGREEAN